MFSEGQCKNTAIIPVILVRYFHLDEQLPHMGVKPSIVGELSTKENNLVEKKRGLILIKLIFKVVSVHVWASILRNS